MTILKGNSKEAAAPAFIPKPIETEVPEQAKSFASSQTKGVSQFTIDPLMAETTGVSTLGKKHYEQDVAAGVLEKLKAVQEKAYADGKELGRLEGSEEAFKAGLKQITENCDQLHSIYTQMVSIKPEMIAKSEATILQAVFLIAKNIALKAVEIDPQIILSVLRSIIEQVHADEDIRVRLNPLDLEFLKQMKVKAGDPLEKLKLLKLEGDENVSRGGCTIEGNYGAIDASLETRVSRAFSSIEAKFPKVIVETVKEIKPAQVKEPKEQSSEIAAAPLQEQTVASESNPSISSEATKVDEMKVEKKTDESEPNDKG